METYIPRILKPELKTVCATTLYNLSLSYGSLRSDMVVKGAVRCCAKLVKGEQSTGECLFLATKALGNMCQDLSSRRSCRSRRWMSAGLVRPEGQLTCTSTAARFT